MELKHSLTEYYLYASNLQRNIKPLMKDEPHQVITDLLRHIESLNDDIKDLEAEVENLESEY